MLSKIFETTEKPAININGAWAFSLDTNQTTRFDLVNGDAQVKFKSGLEGFSDSRYFKNIGRSHAMLIHYKDKLLTVMGQCQLQIVFFENLQTAKKSINTEHMEHLDLCVIFETGKNGKMVANLKSEYDDVGEYNWGKVVNMLIKHKPRTSFINAQSLHGKGLCTDKCHCAFKGTKIAPTPFVEPQMVKPSVEIKQPAAPKVAPAVMAKPERLKDADVVNHQLTPSEAFAVQKPLLEKPVLQDDLFAFFANQDMLEQYAKT